MSSSELLDVLQVLQLVVYGGLGVAAVVHWRHRPGHASAWLAATFGVLSVVVVAGQLLPESSDETMVLWARKAMVAILGLFPYCLYRFTTSLIRPIPWIWKVAPVLTAGVVLGALLLPDFPEQGEPRPGWVEAYIALLLIQWVFLTSVVAVRLWRAGRGRPTALRRRMRTMSLGAAALAAALVVAGEFSDGREAAVLVQLLALGAAPLMLVGFAPPYALRAAWRRREEAALNEAVLSLMAGATDSEVARILLPHSRLLVDAGGAFLQDANGEIIAADGIDREQAHAVIRSLGEDAASSDGASNGALVIPMRSGQLTVLASPLTPFFGHDEISRLEELAALADLALARNELLEGRRRFAEIVESSDDAIIAKSLDGTITSWNRGAKRIYGYRAEEVIGKPISMLVPPDIEDEVPAILEKVRRGERIEHYETRRRSKDGRTIDVSLTISPIRDSSGRITGASAIARDVSINKAVERERESAREEANRANRAKNEFLSRMSHELRTPLNAVLGFAQLLDMDPLTPEQRDGTTEIIKAGKHLLELINEVLDISRIEAGSMQLSLEPVDVVQAVEECISLLTPLAGGEGVTLSLQRQDLSDGPTYVTADRQRVKQVLLNLVANGIKHNREAGSVSVSFEPMEQGRRLRIDVTDTGHGIRADRMDLLFAPFERLGAEGSGIEGTGLGLALSQRLVEAMGGTISVRSELAKGTTFSVELASAEVPVMTEEDEGARAGGVAMTATTSRTILYIEDNLSNLKLVERLVTRRPDIRLISAMQGTIGVTLARDNRPDLILLDLNLPDLPGAEVIARLHSDPRTAELPVVVISADATMGQVKRLLDAGARDYLTKPLDVNRFFEVLDAFCAEPRPTS